MGLYSQGGINRGVTTGQQPELLGSQRVQVISAAIIDVNGVPFLADNITAQEVTDLIGVEVASIVDNGDDTYTITNTDGTSITITTGEGQRGPVGPQGPQPVFGDPTEQTLAPGSMVSVDITGAGTADNPYILSFAIPRGATGEAGDEVTVFFADNENGLNGSRTHTQGQYFIQFLVHPAGETPDIPTSGYFNFRGPAGPEGQRGPTGDDIIVYFADDAAGTNASTSRGANQFFVTFVSVPDGTSPPVPTSGYIDLQGEQGQGGDSVTVYYANNAAGAGASTARQDGQFFIRFLTHPADMPPITPPTGNYIDFRGPQGQDGAVYTLATAMAGDNATITLDSNDATQEDSVITIVAGSNITLTESGDSIEIDAVGIAPIHHANLRPAFAVSPLIFTNGGDAATITGIPSATIEDPNPTDSVNSVIIHSAHSTLRDNTLAIQSSGSQVDFNRFTWQALSSDTPQTVTFTCAFTVNYTIGGVVHNSQFNMTSALTIQDPIEPYYVGNITQAVFDTLRTANYTTIIAQSGVTSVEGVQFNIPFTHTYTGVENMDRFAFVMHPSSAGDITNAISEGFVFNNLFSRQSIFNGPIEYDLHIVEDALTGGNHSVTWRN